MQSYPLLFAAAEITAGPTASGEILPPFVVTLIFLGLAVLAVLLLLILVVMERGRSDLMRKQLQVQILTHLQASYPGAETDLEFLPGTAEGYKDMTPDAREAAKSFFDFWAERFHWRRQGLIDPVIWGAWDRGLAQQLQRPGLRVAWEERHSREGIYEPAFKDYIKYKM
jgi:hypothetical protein